MPLLLPELWQSKVRSWFAQAEAQLVTSSVTASLTKYYHTIKALQESSIEHIPKLLVLPIDNPYLVLKRRLIELYDLSDYERAELLMAPSMLLDKMRALTPPDELKRPTSLFWYAFFSRLPLDIRVHCVPFVGVETLADVARHADAQFRAWLRPAALPQVYSVPQEPCEYGDEIVAAVQDAVNARRPGPGTGPSRHSSATTTPTLAAVSLNVRNPATCQCPRKTSGAGIKEPPFLP